MTGDGLPSRDFAQDRHPLPAIVNRNRAARGKPTAFRQVHWAWQVALQSRAAAPPAMLWRKRGRGSDQRLGVRMARRGKDPCRRCALEDLAQIHHRDLVADVAHDAKVMTDEQIGQPSFALHTADQVQHLHLHRHVQRRDRLVKDDQVGFGRQRARQSDPLPLPALELVRVKRFQFGAQPDLGQQLLNARIAVHGLAEAQQVHGLPDDPPDALARVQ